MELKQAISAIIERRNAKAMSFANRQKTYEGIMQKVQNVIEAKSSINGLSAKAATYLGEDFIEAVQAIDTTPFVNKYDALMQKINEVKARYLKEEINISVIGMARMGKSKLLQSISGLNDSVIPAFPDLDCTGAVSVIRNVDGARVSARVFFYSTTQIMQIINQYIRSIGRDIVKEVRSLSEVQELNIAKLREAIIAEHSSDGRKCDQLERYVTNYEVWSKLVERYGNVGDFMELSNEADIIKYVAQYDNDKQPCFNYMAVSRVEISCSFNYSEAGKIVLRDTIGLGDAKMVGLNDAMLDSIAGDCDAAIVIKRPKDKSDDFRDEDDRLYQILRNACVKRGMDMNQWFFYVINHIKSKDNAAGYAVNTDVCNTVNAQIADLAKADSYIADVSDKDEVTNKILIPMLNKLKDNLPSLDTSLEEQVERLAEEVFIEYERLMRACIKANSTSSTLDNIREANSGDFSERWRKFTDKLSKLEVEYKKNRDKDNSEFQLAVAALEPTDDGADHIMPDVKVIEKLFNAGNDGSPIRVSEMLSDYLRCEFTKRFVDMDEVMNNLVYDMQKRVCEILIDPMQLNEIVDCTPDEYNEQLKAERAAERRQNGLEDEEDTTYVENEKYGKWLMHLYDTIVDCGIFRNQMYSNMLMAIKFVAQFDISVRSFMMHKVRSSIDKLQSKEIVDFAQTLYVLYDVGNYAEAAVNLREVLLDLCHEVYDDVVAKARSLYKDPNNLLYAAVSEFVDKMIRSSVVIGRNAEIKDVRSSWENFYSTGQEEHVFDREQFRVGELAKTMRKQFKDMIDSRMRREEFLKVD